MAGRVHMTAPDGRTFTFAEWCAYLESPDHDTHVPYRTQYGDVFSVDGFVFNVNGYCLNPHVIHVAPEGDRMDGQLTYVEIRTFRKWYSLKDRRPVWWYSAFHIGCDAYAFGRLSPDDSDDERLAIVRCIQGSTKSLLARIAWYDDAIKKTEEETTYPASRRRNRKMVALLRDTMEDYVQLSLF